MDSFNFSNGIIRKESTSLEFGTLVGDIGNGVVRAGNAVSKGSSTKKIGGVKAYGYFHKRLKAFLHIPIISYFAHGGVQNPDYRCIVSNTW